MQVLGPKVGRPLHKIRFAQHDPKLKLLSLSMVPLRRERVEPPELCLKNGPLVLVGSMLLMYRY